MTKSGSGSAMDVEGFKAAWKILMDATNDDYMM